MLIHHLPDDVMFHVATYISNRAMTELNTVTVVDVHAGNASEMWPSLLLAMKTATFVGIDAELSGLGDRRKLNAKSVEDRYTTMCEVSKSRAVLSLGLAYFKHIKTGDQEVCTYMVQCFNITLLCKQDYVVEPGSLKFLVDHGFDFNHQYSQGISYYRGNDVTNQTDFPRQLFGQMVASKVPLVVHNGLVDLVFMYQNFYANLPATMTSFVADLSEMFPAGIFDTKYIAEFTDRMPASYLEYVFRKCQRDNNYQIETGAGAVVIEWPIYPPSCVDVGHLPCKVNTVSANYQTGSKNQVCENFAALGWCNMGKLCPNSHDIDLILENDDLGEVKKRRKRNRKRKPRHPQSNAMGPEHATDDMHNDATGPEHASDDMQQNMAATSEDEADDNSSMEVECIDKSLEAVVLEINDKQDSEIISSSITDETINGDKPEPNICLKGGHRAGFDAFMTAYTFAVLLAKHGKNPSSPLAGQVVEEMANRICLCGKDIPLHIMKSSYSKTSKEHRLKLERLRPETR